MQRSILSLVLLAGVPAAVLVGCSTAPKTASGQNELQRDSDRALQQAVAQDPTLRPVLDRSAGYAVFPTVGEGGFIVGGGYGKGALYEHGQFTGFADITSISGGLKIGGEKFSQLIVFETQEPLSSFKNGQFTVSADAKAVALHSGAAANAPFDKNIQIYTWSQSGLMADASVGGQSFRFTPADVAAQAASDRLSPSEKDYSGYKEYKEVRPAGSRLHSDVEVIPNRDVNVDVNP